MTLTTALSDFLNWLDKTEKIYFIPWGYENLPQVSGGDLDICIHPMDYYNVAEWLRHQGYTSEKCPRFDESHQHEHFVGECSIDMFTSLCFACEGKTVVLNIDPIHFHNSAKLFGTVLIASPATEALFTALRIIGGRKDCVKRLEKFFA